MTYVRTEDRLLLKVSTSDSKEYRAWCTRHFTRLLMEHLESMFENEVDEQQVVPEAARKEVARMQHGSEVAEDSFRQPYEAEPDAFPLGEDGILLTQMRYKTLESGAASLNLSGVEGKGITLNLDKNLRHQVYELFRRAAERAAWFDSSPATSAPVVH